MLYTGDFVLRYMSGFRKIRSHMISNFFNSSTVKALLDLGLSTLQLSPILKLSISFNGALLICFIMTAHSGEEVLRSEPDVSLHLSKRS